MLRFDSLPPVPGGVHLHETAQNALDTRAIDTPRIVGGMVLALLMELGSQEGDIKTIMTELADEIPEKHANGFRSRAMFFRGAGRECERIGLGALVDEFEALKELVGSRQY